MSSGASLDDWLEAARPGALALGVAPPVAPVLVVVCRFDVPAKIRGVDFNVALELRLLMLIAENLPADTGPRIQRVSAFRRGQQEAPGPALNAAAAR